MSVLFVLVIVGILVASVFLIAFIWAVRSGQYDDSYTPSVRILFDDTVSSENNDGETQKDKKQEKKSI
ncbi:MAG TPA: cbb3-type cytochrome oxidase assembly protein CcoS [Sunxiuqinia sp.]|nr:cbb3-type cytochrome oxidase assembly protein CcoS [Sunxiuqinia sp.]